MKGVVTAHDLMREGRFTPLHGGVLKAGWVTTVDLPPDARICAVGMLRSVPTLWEQHAVIDVETGVAWEDTPCHILAVVDGYPHEGIHPSTYVGTILPAAGTRKAWHVFTTSGELLDGEVPR